MAKKNKRGKNSSAKVRKSVSAKKTTRAKKLSKKAVQKELQMFNPTEGKCSECGKKVTSMRFGMDVFCQNHKPEEDMPKMSKSQEEAVRKRLKFFGIRLKF